jgi:acetaldehyde dehydrogenase/alcohol dehydrogenase
MQQQLPHPLDQLDEVHTAILLSILKEVSFPAGSCIFRLGSPGDCCFIIDEGRVRLEVPLEGSSGGESEHVLEYLGSGEMLGEMALLDRLPRSASAYTETVVRARRIDINDLDELLIKRPTLVQAVYAALGREASLKLRHTTARLARLMFDQPQQKSRKK